MQPEELTAAVRFGIAALIGLAVGLERQWSGHATGPDARFAGLRTFLLLGALGGIAGLFVTGGHEALAAVLAAGCVVLAIVAFAASVRKPGAEVDATTEVAAIVVVALGVMAGIGWMKLAAGAGSVVVLALNEKTRLHGAVEKVGEIELRAALRFAVLALVVLPLLPSSAVLAGFEMHPRALWGIVLFFSALNFAGYIARKVVRPDRGYSVTGMLGGLISSTGVTLLFARRSRVQPELSRALAAGVIAACTVLVPRVLIVSTALSPSVGLLLLPYLAAPLLVGAGAIALSWRSDGSGDPPPEPKNVSPLRIGAAIGLAVAFQIAMMAIEFVRARWATPGLYTLSALLGLTDVDALTVSMSQAKDMTSRLAARAIAVGILANTIAKIGLAASLGDRHFRARATAALALMAIVTAAALWLL